MYKKVSIYHAYDCFLPLKDDFDDKKIYETDSIEGMEEFMTQILYTIYKYRCINKLSIIYCMNFKRRNRWKEKNLKIILKKFRKEGYVRAYGTKKSPLSDHYEVVVYFLTLKGVLYLKERRKMISIDNIYDVGKIQADKLLKQASIAQYHINIVRKYGFMVSDNKFEAYKTKTGEVVPSVIRFAKHNVKSRRKDLLLLGFPAPRKEVELEKFLESLLRVINAEVEKTDVLKLIMVVCENNSQVSWISRNINKYRQMRPFPVLYILDMVTASENPLSHILSYETNGEEIRKSNINFMKSENCR